MTRLATYDGNEVHGNLAGISLGKDNPAEDAWIIEQDGPSWEYESAANGDVCRWPTHQRVLKVKYKCKGVSSDNAKLSALHNLDENNPTGSGVGAFLLKDANGGTLYAGQGWVEGIPPNALGKKRGDVEWTIIVVRQPGQSVVGGN